MNGLFNEITIGIIVAVVGGLIGYLGSVYRIKYEYKIGIIRDRTKDFLDNLQKHYMPLGYYSALLMVSSRILSSELEYGEKKDDSIKRMLFDLGNYIHSFLKTSEILGYPIFPNYERKFKIALHHMGILKATSDLLSPDLLTISILRKISERWGNDYEEFSKEIDKLEILKKIKDILTKDSMHEIDEHCYGMYKTIEESIDSTLEPWYISCFREAYVDRERIRKEYEEKIRDMFSPEKKR